MNYRRCPKYLTKIQMTPPEIIGSVRLSSRDPISKASATPATMPVIAATTPRVGHAAVTAPGGTGTVEGTAPNGARYPQNPAPMAAPVRVAANEPARDLRAAKGRRMRVSETEAEELG